MHLDSVTTPTQSLLFTGQTHSGASLLPVIVGIAGLPGAALSSLGSPGPASRPPLRLDQIQAEG